MTNVGGGTFLPVPPLPLCLTQFMVLSFGHVDTGRPPSVWEHEPPTGYRSTRRYQSFIDPTVQCTYTCRVDAEHGVARYVIVPSDDPTRRLVSYALDMLMPELHTAIAAARDEALRRGVPRERVPAPAADAILSGRDFFGLSHPDVQAALRAVVHNAYLRTAAPARPDPAAAPTRAYIILPQLTPSHTRSHVSHSAPPVVTAATANAGDASITRTTIASSQVQPQVQPQVQLPTLPPLHTLLSSVTPQQ